MSSFYLFGNFAVAGGSRVFTEKTVSAGSSGDRTVRTPHILYDTTVSLTNSSTIQASLRVYGPPNENPLPPQTVVFAVAKAFAPANGTILMDVLTLVPYPGNPDDDSYDDFIPDFPATLAMVTGPVHMKPFVCSDDSKSRGFFIEASEYVRDTARVSSIQAVFDGASARWSKTPIPNARSNVQIYGYCQGLTTNGCLSINVVNITFNIGSSVPSHGGGPPDNGNSPSKRRKLVAYSGNTSTAQASSSTVSVPVLGSTDVLMQSSRTASDNALQHQVDFPFAGPSGVAPNPASVPGMLSFSSHPTTLPPPLSVPTPTVVRAVTSNTASAARPAADANMPVVPPPTPDSVEHAVAIGAHPTEDQDDTPLSAKAKGKRKARN